jgi:CRISPR-associated protein Csb2
MPLKYPDQGDRTKVFDAFVVLNRTAEVVVLWPHADLATAEHCASLELLLANLGFFGRAESWCSARLLSAPEVAECQRLTNCRPLDGLSLKAGHEPVRVLCADPQTTFGNEYTPRVKRTTGKGKAKTVTITPLYDPDWHLCMETLQLHDQKWSDAPGSRWVMYSRASDCFKVERRQTVVPPRNRFTVARYVLDGSVLPLVEDTLPLADELRSALMGTYRWIKLREKYGRNIPENPERFASEVFSGKDAAGHPLTGHRHAFYLPDDEDGDGRIDHLTVVAAHGFDPAEIKAFDRLRQLRFGEGDPLNLLLLGLGMEGSLRARVLGESAVWVSATPFIATRKPKRYGSKRDRPELLLPSNDKAFAQHVLHEECARLRERRPDLLPPVEISPLPEHRMGAHRLRPIQFRRFRRKQGDDGGNRPMGGFRIVFSQPVAGPVCLGHSCHFGLGLFVPEES